MRLGASTQGATAAQEIGGGGTQVSRLPADADAAAAAAAAATLNAACDGLCASNELRQSAEVPLHCIRELLSPPYATGSHDVFAAACGGAAAAVDGIEFAALVQMQDVLKIDKELQGRRAPATTAISSLRSHARAQTTARLDSRLAQLRAPGPPISGKSLVGVPRLPPHLRGATLSQLHVLCRLRAAAGAPDLTLQGTPNSWPSWTTAAAASSTAARRVVRGDSLKAPYAQKRGK